MTWRRERVADASFDHDRIAFLKKIDEGGEAFLSESLFPDRIGRLSKGLYD